MSSLTFGIIHIFDCLPLHSSPARLPFFRSCALRGSSVIAFKWPFDDILVPVPARSEVSGSRDNPVPPARCPHLVVVTRTCVSESSNDVVTARRTFFSVCSHVSFSGSAMQCSVKTGSCGSQWYVLFSWWYLQNRAAFSSGRQRWLSTPLTHSERLSSTCYWRRTIAADLWQQQCDHHTSSLIVCHVDCQPNCSGKIIV